MPLLIYRQIAADLLKVLALTTLVLVTVIAFGATVKPLTDGGILGPLEAMRYLLFALVPMLQFALPFAAGFASTIVLHRMTSDNEIQAAAASGISYRRLLMPVVAMGLALTLVMVVLTQSIIPRFWSHMERAIATDVARLLQHSVSTGAAARLGSIQIFADDVRIVVNPADTGADVRLVLFRVAGAELDSQGRIESDFTASQAIVDVHRRRGETYLKLATGEAVAYEGATGQRGGLGLGTHERAIVVPSPMRDTLRARTRTEILELRRHPERHVQVREARDNVERALRERESLRAIDLAIRERGEVELLQQAPARRRSIIRADAFLDGAFTMPGGRPVVVRQFDGTLALRQMAADEVRISRGARTADGDVLFDLDLVNVEVTDLRAGGVANRRSRLSDRGFALAVANMPDFRGETSSNLAALAEASGAAPEAARWLLRRIELLHMEITSRLLARHAQSVMAGLILVLGATLAMLLRGALPLVVYVWAFVPSILNLIMISGGDKMMRDGNTIAGFTVMWGGNALLLLIFLVAYWKLSKN